MSSTNPSMTNHQERELSGSCAQFFTVRRYASMVCAVVMCLSVRPSVRPLYAGIVPKRRITQTTLYDSQETLVFWCQRSWRYSNRVTPDVRLKWQFSSSISLYFRIGTRWGHSFYGTLIWTCMLSIEWCYLQWPWVTPDYPKPPHFRNFVLPFVGAVSDFKFDA